MEGEQAAKKRPSTMLEEAAELKKQGNALYEKSKFAEAVPIYRDAIARLPPEPDAKNTADHATTKGKVSEAVDDEDEGEDDENAQDIPEDSKEAAPPSSCAMMPGEEAVYAEIDALRVVLNINLATSYLKLEHFQEAVDACTRALKGEPTNAKALYRRGVAHEKLGGWSHLNSSLKDFQKLDELDRTGLLAPSYGPEIKAALKRLPPQIEQSGEQEKQELMGKFKKLGDSVLGYFGLSTDNFQMTPQEGGGYALNFQR